MADGKRVRVGGLVLVRQRPGSAKGVLFITLEDETSPANLIVWPAMFERYRRVVLSASMLGCEGRLQREGAVLEPPPNWWTPLLGSGKGLEGV